MKYLRINYKNSVVPTLFPASAILTITKSVESCVEGTVCFELYNGTEVEVRLAKTDLDAEQEISRMLYFLRGTPSDPSDSSDLYVISEFNR